MVGVFPSFFPFFFFGFEVMSQIFLFGKHEERAAAAAAAVARFVDAAKRILFHS